MTGYLSYFGSWFYSSEIKPPSAPTDSFNILTCNSLPATTQAVQAITDKVLSEVKLHCVKDVICGRYKPTTLHVLGGLAQEELEKVKLRHIQLPPRPIYPTNSSNLIVDFKFKNKIPSLPIVSCIRKELIRELLINRGKLIPLPIISVERKKLAKEILAFKFTNLLP
jgi:hypothetical protein